MSPGFLMILGVIKMNMLVFFRLVLFSLKSQPSRGISPKIGTLYSPSVSSWPMMPPMTMVLLSLTRTVVVAVRLKVVGLSAAEPALSLLTSVAISRRRISA